jgi:HlyD family secretion protein
MKRYLVIPLLFLLAGCGDSSDKAWLGYAEGDNVFVAAPQAGWVAGLHVQRGSMVKPDDLLFRLDNTQQRANEENARAAIDVAKAGIVQAQADLDYAAKNLARQRNLVAANAGTKQNLDLAQSAYSQAVARVNSLRAQEAQARAGLTGSGYQLSEREVRSRVTGRVEDVYFREGEYAPASTPVLSILPPGNVFVRFFVPETEFAKVKMGDHVMIHCDGCGPDIEARVTFIAQQEEFTPPVIFSEGNREKLVFKLEARLPGGLKLNPGQPVEVRPALK